MSPRVQVVDDYPEPGYPGRSAPPEFARRRYSGSVLDRLRERLSRPLVVLGLYAALSLPAAADDEDVVEAPAEPDARPGERSIRMLSPAEVGSLVCGLERIQDEAAPMVRGRVAGQMGFLTEEEGRAILKAFFEKNGFTIADDVAVRDRFLDFTADGFDARSRVGFEFLGPNNPSGHLFEPAESDLSAAEIAEIELAGARRGTALLVLDGSQYAFNVRFMGHLPTKAQAVDRLLEDVRRYFVWLAGQGRLGTARAPEEDR